MFDLQMFTIGNGYKNVNPLTLKMNETFSDSLNALCFYR